MSKSRSLRDSLADTLPKDVPFTFYHISTPPSKSPALYSAPPHQKPERTFCESHFLGVSISPKDGQTRAPPEELLVLAIEVLIYSTRRLTTIFVSKADSTGYLSLLSLPRSAGSPLKAVCGTFVSWLVKERLREGKKLVVSLFARAQDQYLFPASIDNPSKHVLDDRELVKWWCKVLDPLVWEYAKEKEQRFTDRLGGANGNGQLSSHSNETIAKGYLVVPGLDTYETTRYIPPPPSPTQQRRWVASHPLRDLTPHPGAPPRCLIPHFPDDPKSRFLDELDEELPDRDSQAMTQPGGTPSRSNGQWKSVKTLDEFWEMMAFRQECSSGRITGFIWVVITPPKPSIPETEEPEEEEEESAESQKFQDLPIPPTPKPPKTPKTPRSHRLPRTPKSTIKKRKMHSRRRGANTTTGPIPLRLPRIKALSNPLPGTTTNLHPNSNHTASKLPPEKTHYFVWPATSRGSLLLSRKDYDRAHEVLIKQNFCNRVIAAKSTKRWRDEVSVLAGAVTKEWGWDVVGRKESNVGAENGANAGGVTMLVTKKRKAVENGESKEKENGVVAARNGGVQVLGEGLVRKRVKTNEAALAADQPQEQNGVNMLSSGLVRKKPKVK